MSYYRDAAQALARRAPENFIGVALYVPVGGRSTSPFWSMSSFTSSEALEEWYEETAISPALYYYLAAFDKTRSSSPVGESIAPPRSNQPGFDIKYRDQWRHPPFRKPTTGKAEVGGRGHYRPFVGADAPRDRTGAAVPVIIMVGFTTLLVAVLRDEARLNRGR